MKFQGLLIRSLLSDARSVIWDEVVLADDVNSMVQNCNAHITILCDEHLPMVAKRITKQPAPQMLDIISDAAF